MRKYLFAAAGIVSVASIWATASPAGSTKFTDVTSASGIRFTHNAAKEGKKWLPETMGPGCAFVDLDGDGWLDIVLINGRDWTPKKRKTLSAVYRNNQNGTFTDVTRGSGLDVELFGMGVSAGDFDNDARPDLYITAMEGDRLLRNEGNFKFRDVTAQAGIRNANFGTSSAWFDYDKDGNLDLIVANYVQWSPQSDLWCSLDGAKKSYCTPESYKGTTSRLFRNLGNGKFEEVTERAKLHDPSSKALGIAILDYNQDGWPDIFLANDTQPNKLYKNNGDGTFTEEGLAAGVAFDESGVARGAMGVDAADYDGSGRPHLVVGNFSNQMLGLYRNEGRGLFVDEAPRSSVGRETLLTLAFGVFFFDFDLDGKPDIFVANGHIEEDIERVQPKVRFRQAPHLFRNLGKGRFEDVAKDPASGLSRGLVARGAAYGDFDRDGDLDVLVTTNGGPAYLFRNDTPRGNFLRVKTEGTRSNRDGIGTVVRIVTSEGWQTRTVHTGSSYCSQSETAVTFGLGGHTRASIEIEWPSGTRQSFRDVPANQILTIREDRGIVAQSGPEASGGTTGSAKAASSKVALIH
jgi:enediyne biosynthesis protein E4